MSRLCRGVTVLAIAALLAAAPKPRLRILEERYPRAFFFRSAEVQARNANLSYGQWEAAFERLLGIEGKALDEELPGTSVRNIDFFTRFKRRHPDQLVLLHFNGNSRDPVYRSDAFFAGHWLYYSGARILSNVSATAADSEIRVDNAALFEVGMGRFENSNEDVALCATDERGKPDWNRCEQVTLSAIDAKNHKLRVQRGRYGTKPQSFSAGKAYAAAHVSEGPWGGGANLLWYYNFSTACPRDRAGRTCSDILVKDLQAMFGPGGALASFDGLEFDVLRHYLPSPARGRGIDSDGDGAADTGMIGGVNAYGIGVMEFCRRLRASLGKDRLILADGHMGNQRAFGILNGIESEGWPDARDFAIRDWSGGLNRHRFWNRNAHEPRFSYINHKYTVAGREPGSLKIPELPFAIHRLVFAVAAFTDSAVCYSFPPNPEPGELIGIWDELREPGWLGRPIGPAVRMAEKQPNLVQAPPQVTGTGVSHAREGGAIRIWDARPNLRNLRFGVTVPARGPDLVVTFQVTADPMRGYPPDMPRRYGVSTRSDDPRPSSAWAGANPFPASFYFPDITGSSVDLYFTVEGSEPFRIANLAVHAHPDAIYRVFEHGLALANPSPRSYTFDLGKLFPGIALHRLNGSSMQDRRANNGAAAKGKLELQAKEGLFLRK
jgi:hypothetical protein